MVFHISAASKESKNSRSIRLTAKINYRQRTHGKRNHFLKFIISLIICLFSCLIVSISWTFQTTIPKRFLQRSSHMRFSKEKKGSGLLEDRYKNRQTDIIGKPINFWFQNKNINILRIHFQHKN